MVANVASDNIVKTQDIIGVDVQNSEGEDLGEIEEIVMDKLTGKTRYVVLSFGGFLGMGDKLFALPWNAIHYDKENDVFILDMDKSALENAPGFDKNHWPKMSDRTWEESIFKYYKTKPYWQDRNESDDDML